MTMVVFVHSTLETMKLLKDPSLTLSNWPNRQLQSHILESSRQLNLTLVFLALSGTAVGLNTVKRTQLAFFGHQICDSTATCRGASPRIILKANISPSRFKICYGAKKTTLNAAAVLGIRTWRRSHTSCRLLFSSYSFAVTNAAAVKTEVTS